MLKAECVTNGIQTTSVCMYNGVIINELATGLSVWLFAIGCQDIG